MAKLKTLLAQKLPEWPEGASIAVQSRRARNTVFFYWNMRRDDSFNFELSVKASDFIEAEVTRAQWQAERDRIAANQQATKEAREIASGKGQFFGSVEEMCAELEALATGQKPPYAFTEADIRAAFEAGANWMRGAVGAGAAEYVDKLKGLK